MSTVFVPDQPLTLSSRYRQFLALYAVVVFYASATPFLYRMGIIPLYTTAALGVLTAPLAVSRYGLVWLTRQPLTWWCSVYLAVTFVGFLTSGQSAIAFQEVQDRVLAVAVLLTMVLVLADEATHPWARWLILWGLVVGLVVNIWESMATTGVDELTRATGLHTNPNVASAAMVGGWIVCAGLLKDRLRHALAIAVGLGVLVTNSRGAIVLWVVVLFLMLKKGDLRLSGLLQTMLLAVVGLSVPVAIAGEWQLVTDKILASLGESTAVDRLTVLAKWDVTQNPSTVDRWGVAVKAWLMFTERPLLGYGVGATTWIGQPSTHNMYVRHLAEHGLIGFALYPAFVYAIVWRAWTSGLSLASWFAAFLALWALVSHDVLYLGPCLPVIALVAVMFEEAPGTEAQAGATGVTAQMRFRQRERRRSGAVPAASGTQGNSA